VDFKETIKERCRLGEVGDIPFIQGRVACPEVLNILYSQARVLLKIIHA
jgi:hypothetical protein